MRTDVGNEVRRCLDGRNDEGGATVELLEKEARVPAGATRVG